MYATLSPSSIQFRLEWSVPTITFIVEVLCLVQGVLQMLASFLLKYIEPVSTCAKKCKFDLVINVNASYKNANEFVYALWVVFHILGLS